MTSAKSLCRCYRLGMTSQVVDLYLRKSTKDEGRSVARQQHELTAAAEGEDLTLGRVFVDPDLSASRFARRERPDYAALLEHVRSGGCQVVGILEASRGSRGLTEWSAFLDLCRRQHVKIWVSTHERIYDLSRRRDWRALADEGLDAADESEKLSERVLSGKRKAAREGTPAGRLQYGFTRIYDASGKLVEQTAHPEQAPIVAEMVRRIAEGDRLAVIARDLNARGLTMPGGSPWHGRFIRQMVLRPAYAGRRVHQGEDVGPAAWEPIVDVDQWRRAVAILTRPERRTTTRGTELAHWLTGAVTCGTCRDTKLRARTGGTKRPRVTYQCDRCGMVVAAGSLESVVEEMILGRLKEPDALAALRPQANDAEVRAAEELVRTLTERLEAHYIESARGKLSARALTVIEGELLPEIERAKAKARRLSLPAELDDVDPAEVVAKWGDFRPEQKRTYARVLTELVVTPAARRGPAFDIWRLAGTRWVGDAVTWGEMWREAGVI
ncbi:recombinase family protein [Dactylosporangium sp. CA-139114]|uniref:recombinase family protein n=1 Tax=Dactylosporangium sp. CA-139114 TaxID=3239931 RepID=UPI003D9858B2